MHGSFDVRAVGSRGRGHSDGGGIYRKGEPPLSLRADTSGVSMGRGSAMRRWLASIVRLYTFNLIPNTADVSDYGRIGPWLMAW